MSSGTLQISLSCDAVPVNFTLQVDSQYCWWEPPSKRGEVRIPVVAGSHELQLYIPEQPLDLAGSDVQLGFTIHFEEFFIDDEPWTREINIDLKTTSGEKFLGQLLLAFELPGLTPVTFVPPFDSSDLLMTSNRQRQRPRTLHGVTIVDVFYATDRIESRLSDEFFGNNRAAHGTLQLGFCEVGIPIRHSIGEVERPRWWHFEWSEDPERHVVIQSVTPTDDNSFFVAIRDRVAAAPTEEQVFVFIHGYNVTFADAVRRTAQIAHDLKFRGAAAVFSWPAEQQWEHYFAAEATAEWTIAHFENFLRQLAARSGAQTIHLIGHSLGNRIMAAALNRISADRSVTLPMFKQVILTAPDIDRGVFEQIADALKKSASRITVYVSCKDKALNWSERIHSFPRLGLAPPGVLVVSGVDTIDASNVDTSFFGHSYAEDASTVLADLSELIRNGKPPDERFGLELTCDGYWEFRRRRY